MKIIKRSGEEQVFDISKIIKAISKANITVDEKYRLSEEQINSIANQVEAICKKKRRASSVEEIQDLVENEIMRTCNFDVARNYITYILGLLLEKVTQPTNKF